VIRTAIVALLLAFAAVPSAGAIVGKMSLRQSDVKIRGGERDDIAGYSLAGLGDVNGDRKPDVAVGAGRRRGEIYVLFGPLRRSTASLKARMRRRQGFRITSDRDLAVEPAGDVNGDGRADLIVRSLRRENENAEPPTYVVFGRGATSVVDLRRLGAGGFRIDGGGLGAAGGGDVNGDGRTDVAVTVPSLPGSTDPGNVYLIFGKADSGAIDLRALGTQGYRIDGEIAAPVTFVDDLNGDGRSEVAFVGGGAAPGREGTNSVYVVYGKSDTAPVSLSALAGRGYQIFAGSRYPLYDLAGAGDVNRDDRGDILVAGSESEGDLLNASTAYVVFGVRDVPVDLATATWPGYSVRAPYITSLANAGDTNGDGRPDALIGAGIAEPESRNNAFRGASLLVYGRDGGTAPLLDSIYIEATSPRCECYERSDNAGWAVAGAGDQNGDGRSDLLIGAPRVSDSGSARFRRPGTAHVVFSPRVLLGTDRRETLRGTSGNDLMIALGGNDTLRGGAGNDTFDGGAGRDRIDGGSGSNRLEGGPGDDVLVGGRGADDLFGGYDILDRGATGQDRLLGGPGDDFLSGGDRPDVIDAGTGNDIAYGGRGNDGIFGRAGRDLLFGDGIADYSLRNFSAGGTGWDRLDGGSANDVFWAGGGPDILFGRSGNDIFHAGDDTARDLVDGGPGRDRYDRRGGRERDALLSIERVF
jgi:Ca2+-binding RTX toxin-like protein